VQRLDPGLPGGVTVLDPRDIAERYVAPLAELCRHKGWTTEVARERLADPITVGTMLLRQGEVDGLVCGAAHTTAATVRPALQIIGTRPGCRLVSLIHQGMTFGPPVFDVRLYLEPTNDGVLKEEIDIGAECSRGDERRDMSSG
jgi:phosphotransacetylase